MRGERGVRGRGGGCSCYHTSAIDDHVFLSRSYQLADITGAFRRANGWVRFVPVPLGKQVGATTFGGVSGSQASFTFKGSGGTALYCILYLVFIFRF